jgi:uncharacterized LabA/DUF88 family protein
MPVEPSVKRAIAFLDGQNLYYAARDAFGHRFPSYDPMALSKRICLDSGWTLAQVRFYTGIPNPQVNPVWYDFWCRKLAVMGTRGIVTFTRSLKYRNETVVLPDGKETTVFVGREKGIDVRLALDVVRLARANELDVALIFSQDQDLSEVADEVKAISMAQNRWIKMACAFPYSPTYDNARGINKTDWIKMDKALYDACLDPNDYRTGGKP